MTAGKKKTREILAKAIDVFGSSEAARRFLKEPVMALDRQRPIDLLATPAGAELVERHLARVDSAFIRDPVPWGIGRDRMTWAE